MKKLKIQDVKPIGQGHRVEKAEHRSEAKAQVLSVIPRAFRWIKNNACVFICFSCTEHLFKSLSLLCASFLLSIKLFVIIKELQFCSPLLRKVRIRVDKVPDAICHQFRVFYKWWLGDLIRKLLWVLGASGWVRCQPTSFPRTWNQSTSCLSFLRNPTFGHAWMSLRGLGYSSRPITRLVVQEAEVLGHATFSLLNFSSFSLWLALLLTKCITCLSL